MELTHLVDVHVLVVNNQITDETQNKFSIIAEHYGTM